MLQQVCMSQENCEYLFNKYFSNSTLGEFYFDRAPMPKFNLSDLSNKISLNCLQSDSCIVYAEIILSDNGVPVCSRLINKKREEVKNECILKELQEVRFEPAYLRGQNTQSYYTIRL